MRALVAQQAWRLVHVDDNNFRMPIAIEVAHSQSTRRAQCCEGWPGLRRQILKTSVTAIPIEKRFLTVGLTQFGSVHFRINIPVGYDDVFPTVLVNVHKRPAPPEQLIATQSSLLGKIREN